MSYLADNALTYAGGTALGSNALTLEFKINYVRPGFNGGWVQVMGPISRVADYKAIEVAAGFGLTGPAGLQQLRWEIQHLSKEKFLPSIDKNVQQIRHCM